MSGASIPRYPLGAHRFVEAYKNGSGKPEAFNWSPECRAWRWACEAFVVVVQEADELLRISCPDDTMRQAIAAVRKAVGDE